MAPALGTVVLGVVAIGLLAALLVLLARTYGVATFLGQVRTVLRIDAPVLVVGALLLLASAAVVVRVQRAGSTPGRPLVVAALLLIAVPALVVAVANQDWYRAARSLPVTDPGAIRPGPVQVESRVAPTDVLLESPVTDTETVAYRATTLEEHAAFGGGNDTTVWAPAATAAAATDFAVVGEDPEEAADGPEGGDDGSEAPDDGPDGSDDGPETPAEGSLATAGDGLEADDGVAEAADLADDGSLERVDGPSTASDGASRGDAASDAPTPRAPARTVFVDGPAADFPLLEPALKGLGATPGGATVAGFSREVSVEPGFTAPIADELGRGTRSRPRRYVERRLDPGDEVYVLGAAEETADGEYRIVDDGSVPLVVARCSADVAHRQARLLALGGALLGLVAGALGLWLALPAL